MSGDSDQTASPARGGREGALIGIGEAASVLDAEFGDVSVSKIRFLEARGLIAPVRTRGGSRRYSAADLDRLRAVLTLQRRDFLPLDVIAERLGERIADVRPADARSGSGATEQVMRPRREAELSESEFLRRSLCPPEVMSELRRFGLIVRRDPTGLEICAIMLRLREHGIEPRHLRWVRQAAEREVSIVQASVPMRPEASARTLAQIDSSQRRLAADLTDVLALLVRAALDDGR